MASIGITGLASGGARVNVADVVVGLERSIALIEKFGRDALYAAGAELFIEHERIITEAKDKFVPVDEGVLRASGFTELPKFTANSVTVTGGFGGATAPYAFIQHEEPTFEHRVGEYKYYEKVLLAAIAGMDARVASGTQRRVGL